MPDLNRSFSLSSSDVSWSSATTRKTTIISEGVKCTIHIWSPSPLHHHQVESTIKPRGVVCMFHGIPGHANSSTDRYLAELLSSYNYIVYGMDLPGYGESQNLRFGRVLSAKDIIQHGMDVALYAHEEHNDIPLFFSGTGTGGTIALLVSNSIQQDKNDTIKISGMILLEPLIALHDYSRLSSNYATLRGMIPNDFIDSDKQKKWSRKGTFIHPAKRLKLDTNSAVFLVSLLQKCLPRISRPFICLVANDENNINSTEGALDLMHLTPSSDKTLLAYNSTIDDRDTTNSISSNDIDEMFHIPSTTPSSISSNENPSELQRMEHDIVKWLHTRTIGVQHFSSYSASLRIDAEKRRNAVIDELEDAFFS